MILGSFDFEALQQAHRVLGKTIRSDDLREHVSSGPIFFLSYVFFVFFVLLNMFLAIINDTYMEVKAELQNRKNEFEIGDFVKQGYAKMRERLTAKRDRIADIRRALSAADVNRDKRLEFEEWRNEMKARGYAEEEIETMFAKYDTNGDRVLDEDEQKALSNDLLRQNEAILREMNDLTLPPVAEQKENPADVPTGEFEKMTGRLDSLESSVGTILAKIEDVTSKIDVYERPRFSSNRSINIIDFDSTN